jgi:two-component system LytT family response regulator
MKLKCAIIDDEPEAVELLKKIIIDFCPTEAEVIGTSGNVINGLKLLKQCSPDILFLDIEMPDATGFDLIEMLPARDFKIVFVTAYEKHALKAIKTKPFDYLLKPLDIEEVIKVIQLAKKDHKSTGESKSIFKLKIPIKDGSIFISPDDIAYIKGDGRYSLVVLRDQTQHTVAKNIGQFETELSGNKFVRVHKSYLVNAKYISKLNNSDGGFLELESGVSIEVSRRKKKELSILMNNSN